MLKMKEELDLFSKEQVALQQDIKMTIDGFANQLIVLDNKIDHLESSRVLSCSKPELAEGFANDLGTLRHNVKNYWRPVMRLKRKSTYALQG